MSSNKKTAFARKPRGAQVSSQTDNRSGTVRIDKRFLDGLSAATMSPDLSTVLIKSAGELVARIGANGKGNYNISNNAGAVIADSGDVQRIQSLGTFINDERKAVLKSSVSGNTKKHLAALVIMAGDENLRTLIPRPISKFPKGFLDTFRAVSNQAEMMAVNVTAIENLQNQEGFNGVARNYFIETAKRSRNAMGKYLFHRATLADGEVAEKLNSFLSTELVLLWSFARLTSQKMQLTGNEFEIRRILFPRDPTKGLAILYREMITTEIRDNQLGVLDGLDYTSAVFTDANCIRTFCQIPTDWDVTDLGENSPAKVLANVPMLVTPPVDSVTESEVFTAIGRSGDRGLPWSVGNAITPQDSLKFLGTIPKRVFYGLVSRPAYKQPLLARMFPGFQYDASSTTRGVYAQLAVHMKEPNRNVSWFEKVNDTTLTSPEHAESLALIQDVICDILDFGTNDTFRDTVASAILAAETLSPGEPSGGVDLWATAIGLKVSITDDRVQAELEGKLDVSLAPKTKTAKGDGVRLARSPLAIQSRNLIKVLKSKRYIELSLRVEQWLRMFLDSTIQGVVADLILARLEASLSNPVQYGSGDRAGYLESVNFGLDEDEENASDTFDVGGDNDPDNEDQDVHNPDEQ